MSRNILGLFDGGDVEDISALIDRLDKSSFDYLKLEGDGVSIVIGKNGAGEIDEARAAGRAMVKVSAEPVIEAPAVQAAAEIAEKSVVSEQEGIEVVKSPSYGLYYAQPEPGAPPYVKAGDAVKKGDTVGLLEIMKTFTAITSPVDGTVVGIHVRNAEMLEPDQPLVSIKIK